MRRTNRITLRMSITESNTTLNRHTKTRLIKTLTMMTRKLLNTINILTLPIMDIMTNTIIAIINMNRISTHRHKTIRINGAQLSKISNSKRTVKRISNNPSSRILNKLLKLILQKHILKILTKLLNLLNQIKHHHHNLLTARKTSYSRSSRGRRSSRSSLTGKPLTFLDRLSSCY